MELDKLDRDILNILQQDATLPLKELAEKVHSSVATCQRRIQLLTEKGVITKQVAVVSPKAVGRGISVFVMVEMDNQHSRFQELFEPVPSEKRPIAVPPLFALDVCPIAIAPVPVAVPPPAATK